MIDVLLGAFFGDEGKGKIIDHLADNYDIVARYAGGPNAGHSVEFDGNKFVLHLIPSGVFKNKINVIGNGCVINPILLKEEIETLKDFINLDNLYISSKAHLITPYHVLMDALNEKEKTNGNKIGSTLKGIGPTYTDKIARIGLRVGDILDPDFKTRFWNLKKYYNKIFTSKYYYTEPDLYKIEQDWLDAVEFLSKLKIIDTSYFLNWELKNGSKILAEGAQGTLLDIDHGSYPYVTSSNTTIGGVITGLGIPAKYINKVYGVIKAYSTRVGNGPFPTELNDETGTKLRDVGCEYGATTGRPRRCGWLDLVALKYAVMINGITDLIVTKVDILNDFEKIKYCVAYEVDGKETTELPFDLSKATPIYNEITGWMTNDLKYVPVSLNYYLMTISKIVNADVSYISTSPDRKDLIRL